MSLQDPDQITSSKTIYDVGTGEIIWRNFLAGMSRALGGLVIYFAIVIVLANIFMTYMWPTIAPAFETLSETNDVLQQMQLLPTVR